MLSLCLCLDSLEPFAQGICSSVDVQTIVPWMITHGLVTSHDKAYFYNPYHNSVEKQHKLMCLVLSLNEDCVEKFLECLSQTSDYAPHGTLLEKIRNSMLLLFHSYICTCNSTFTTGYAVD